MGDEATEFAATVAPEIDRVRMALVGAAASALGPLAARYGLTPDAAMVASMLRNLPPDRAVRVDDLAELYVYQRDGYTDAALDVLRAIGMVEGDAVIRLTAKGLAGIAEVMEVLRAAAESLWPAVPPEIEPALLAARRAVEQATKTGGVTFGVVAPVHVAPGTLPMTEFLELLTPLRFHRFDAHVAAWRGTGYAAAELDTLGDDERAAIEQKTNIGAGRAYAELTETEREALLAGLRALRTE